MKKILRLIIATSLLVTSFGFDVFADDSLDIKYQIREVSEGKMELEISEGYALLNPTFTLKCTINNPEVIGPNDLPVGSSYDNDEIIFLADIAGVYTIQKSEGNYFEVEANLQASNIKSAKDEQGVDVETSVGTLSFESWPVSVSDELLETFNIPASENVFAMDIIAKINGEAINSLVLNNAIKVTIVAPNEGKPLTGKNNIWKYNVLREHKGLVEYVARGLIADSDGTISFNSDKFSTYVVFAYEAKKPSAGGETNYKAPNTSVQ